MNLVTKKVLEKAIPDAQLKQLSPQHYSQLYESVTQSLERAKIDISEFTSSNYNRLEPAEKRRFTTKMNGIIKRKISSTQSIPSIIGSIDFHPPLVGSPPALPETCLILSGGGMKGSFEVGVLAYLYNIWDKLKITGVTGTSVGSINALAIAESGREGVKKLVDLYLDLETNDDMWLDDPSVATLNSILQNFGFTLTELLSGEFGNLGQFLQNSAAKLGGSFLGGIMGLLSGELITATVTNTYFKNNADEFAAKIGVLAYALEELVKIRGLRSFAPLAETIKDNFDENQLGNIKMRLATICLEDGADYYIDEKGDLLKGSNDGKLDHIGQLDGNLKDRIIDGAMASSSVPFFFPPVELKIQGQTHGNHFVDGGIREILPIKAALDMKYKKIFSVLASPLEISSQRYVGRDRVELNLLSIGLRTLVILSNEITLNDFYFNSSELSKSLSTFPDQLADMIEDPFGVDPGLILINMDYGYMSGYEACLGETGKLHDLNFWQILTIHLSGIEITLLRRKIWELEKQVIFDDPTRATPVFHQDILNKIRSKKKEVLEWVRLRYEASGGDNFCLPLTQIGQTGNRASIHNWWYRWERHTPVLSDLLNNFDLWEPLRVCGDWPPNIPCAPGTSSDENPANVPERPEADFLP